MPEISRPCRGPSPLALLLGLTLLAPVPAVGADGEGGVPDVRKYLRLVPRLNQSHGIAGLPGAIVGALGLTWPADERLTPDARAAASPDESRILLTWGGRDVASGACQFSAVALDSCGRQLWTQTDIPDGLPLMSDAGAAAFFSEQRGGPGGDRISLEFRDREGRRRGVWSAPAEEVGGLGSLTPDDLHLLHSGEGLLLLLGTRKLLDQPAPPRPQLWFISASGVTLWRRPLPGSYCNGVYIPPNDSLFVIYGNNYAARHGDKVEYALQVYTPAGVRVTKLWGSAPLGIYWPLIDPTGRRLYASTGPLRSWELWPGGRPVKPEERTLQEIAARGRRPDCLMAQEILFQLAGDRNRPVSREEPPASPAPPPGSAPPTDSTARPTVASYLRRARSSASPEAAGALLGRLGLEWRQPSGAEPSARLIAATPRGHGLLTWGWQTFQACPVGEPGPRGMVCLFDSLGRTTWSGMAELTTEPLLTSDGGLILFEAPRRSGGDSLRVQFIDPDGRYRGTWARSDAGIATFTEMLMERFEFHLIAGDSLLAIVDFDPGPTPAGSPHAARQLRAIDREGHQRWVRALSCPGLCGSFTNEEGTRLVLFGQEGLDHVRPREQTRWRRHVLVYGPDGTEISRVSFTTREHLVAPLLLLSNDGLRLLCMSRELRALDVATGEALGAAPRGELERLTQSRHPDVSSQAQRMLQSWDQRRAANARPR